MYVRDLFYLIENLKKTLWYFHFRMLLMDNQSPKSRVDFKEKNVVIKIAYICICKGDTDGETLSVLRNNISSTFVFKVS